ncbi:G-type lectin S-receptor-like serine/threonine-protein kinase SD2-2 [Zea mays]|uniref:Receptor-like serine/threonine-protein kinase n=1 Tax=Zea mays TaxID=4577 RepID=A0A317YAC8_MAIZE|nr:G-type lectin S-receptor-like serine/threonine-protein kinase SD2-2 [Zea mays]
MALLKKTHPSITLPIFLLHFCAITFGATDTISRTQPLSGDITIVSKEGNFELGFFSPGNNGNFYVGIWFRTISKRTVIWVAKRDIPVSNASSPELAITMDGNLVLNSLGAPIWSSNSTRKSSRSSTAVLLDSGNLILRDQYNSSDIFWQSFDHPTDTVVSGQWFGIDKITHEYQDRVSWKNQEDPAPGPFSFHADLVTMSQYVSIWNHSEVYWQSGNWTGKAFTSIPGMPLKSDYIYDFVNNSRELKFRWTTKDVSVITRVILSINGQLQRLTWSNDSEEWITGWYFPAALCDVYSVCGPFGVCRTGSDEQCFCLPGFRPASARSWRLGAWSQGCVRQTDIQCAESNKSSGIKESDAFLKITNIKFSQNPIKLKVQSIEGCRSICLSNCSCTAYAHKQDCNIWNSELWDLKQLPNDRVGQGSFGSVFKGLLPDSKPIAVKKLQGMKQGEKQFHTEVRALGKIHHNNLVHLIGFCLRGAERMLVYDFMVNGSLDAHLFKDEKILDWNTRFLIILGVAKGLQYLHDECQECIIHCDIKPENVLLDVNFSPKLADFGLAKLMDRHFSRALTTMRGTAGYLAPEWIGGLPITPKADVYSYGMMLFEIISGRRNSELMESGAIRYFPVWAAIRISEGDISEILDPRLSAVNFQELERACKVACWCIQDNEAHRPTMRQIVQILQDIQDVSVAPVPVFLKQLVDGEYISS